MRRRCNLGLLACAALLIPSWSAAEPAWPAGATIKLVTPTPPGVGTDVFARVYSVRLGQELGTSVVVENRPGASNVLGIMAVAKAPPNGQTLLISVSRPFTTPPELLSKQALDPTRDLAPVAQLYHSGSFVIAGSGFAGRNLQDLIATARQRPGHLSYASYGTASTARLGMELLQDAAGIELLQVPYKLSAIPDVLAGMVTIGYEPTSSALAGIRSGRIRALAYVGERRSAALPDVPTVSEILPGFQPIPTWVGLWVPKGTPDAIIKRLQKAITALHADPAFIKTLADAGVEPRQVAGPQMAAAIRRELELTTRLVKAKNITFD